MFKLRAFLAHHRTVIAAVFGVLASPFLAQFIRSVDPTPGLAFVWFVGFAVTYLIVVTASTSPPQYAKIELLEAMLPTISAVLNLDRETDRITIHHLKSRRRERYEQLTNYYPSNTGKGRPYTFSHGIVGSVFKTRTPRLFTIPEGTPFVAAMKNNWAFSEQEMARLTRDRRAFYAYPIGSDGSVAKAVLYLDSSSVTTLRDADVLKKRIEDYFLRQLEAILQS